MIRQIFVNLPVKDLNKTKEFFGKLGFTFNAQFTDEKAAAMEMGDNKKEIADSSKTTEVINAVSVDTKEKVDEMVEKALKAGGKTYKDPDDYGWMYSRAFQDLDGHLWEVLSMDLSKLPKKETK